MEMEWFKSARIVAEISYPPVSAWEFGQLKTEEAVRERLEASTVYILAQRPMLWFENVVVNDEAITFEINDGQGPHVKGRIEPIRIGLAKPGESLFVESGFHHDATNLPPPWNKVASIKVFDANSNFKVWWSPQKLLYEAIAKKVSVQFAGDAARFMAFEIHYIGKTRDLFRRMKGHPKYQDILIYERIRGEGHAQPSLEITLFAIEITNLEESVSVRIGPDPDDIEVPPIAFRLPDDPRDPKVRDFARKWANKNSKAATTELEAWLINMFKPEHNETLFDNYPFIIGGLRDLNYSFTDLTINNCPYVFRTQKGGTPLDDLDE